MSKRKIDRARRLSTVGRYPETYKAVLATIGPGAIAALSSTALATLADRIWLSWAESKRIAEREVLGDGGVYSEHEGRFIPLVGRDEPPAASREGRFIPLGAAVD